LQRSEDVSGGKEACGWMSTRSSGHATRYSLGLTNRLAPLPSG
jgi:hypothetical protein